MAELARGSVRDRPWGLTLGALGVRGLTGVLRLVTDDRWFSIAFENGTVIDAKSSLISDSMARIAMSTRLVTADQVGEIVRKMAEQPGRDELDVVVEVAGLIAEKAERLRARAIAQRAARTFAVINGEFVIHASLPCDPPTALDVRPIIYLGAMVNMPQQRLEAELARLGTRFELKPDATAELPAYGLTGVEARVAETLAGGATIDELEAAHIDLERHNLCAIVYSLVSGLACRIADPPDIAVPRVDTKRVTSRVDPNTSFTVKTTPTSMPAQPTPSPIARIVKTTPPGATPYDAMDLAAHTPSKPVAPLIERAQRADTDVDSSLPLDPEIRRTAQRWAGLELGEASSEELMRRTANKWAAQPLVDEGLVELSPEIVRTRARSRTEQLLVFAAIEREPGQSLEEDTTSIDLDVARHPPRQHPRAESWLPMVELSPDDLEEI